MLIKPGTVGEVLIRLGAFDSSGLDGAQEVQSKAGGSLGKALAVLGLANKEAVSATLAEATQLEYLTPNPPEITTEIGALLPAKFCRKHLVVRFSLKGNSLRLNMAVRWNDCVSTPVEPHRIAARLEALLVRSKGRQVAGAK
jgi:hypothetical protein